MKGQNTITFYQETYYDPQICDCCEPDELIVWNADPEIDQVILACVRREDCYISAMEYFGYPIREMTGEDCWKYTEDELESIAREYGLVVDFVE